MALVDTLRARLRTYHPLLNQALVGLSLFGILTVAHLYIQQGRNFDRGCFGFSGLETDQVAFDCSAVVSSGAGTFLGLSNITWGFGFYLLIIGMTIAIFWLQSRWRLWVHSARAGALLIGLLYSGYLVYVQVSVLSALCTLCLVSAGIAVLLFVLQLAALLIDLDSSETVMTSRLFKRDLTVYVYLVAFTAILVGADFTYFNALAPADDRPSSTYQESSGGAACTLDTSRDPVENNGNALVGFQDVIVGPSDASVTVIEYFDPNCPHCKDFHAIMEKVVAEYKDRVRFVYKPFALRGSSLPEIQALYVANKQGKFKEMLEGQYARQSRTGITKQDLRDISSEIGMNAEVLMTRLEEDKYREKVISQRKRAVAVGVSSTPSVLVNGHFVGSSRSYECMKIFLDRALNGELSSAASG